MFMYKEFADDARRDYLVGLVTKPDKNTPAQVPGVTATVLYDEGKVEFEGNHGPIDQLRYILRPEAQ